MKLQKIIIENIHIHTNHGCMVEEGKIGSEYTVDIEAHAKLKKAAKSDELSDTVDYVQMNQIVHEEMKKRAKLLETVAARILDRVGKEIPKIKFAKVKISKLNPPMGGNVEKVSVIFDKHYS